LGVPGIILGTALLIVTPRWTAQAREHFHSDAGPAPAG
jgi:hypothetical protein